MGTRDGGLARRGRSFGWPALALTFAALLVAAAAVAAGAAVVTGRSGGHGPQAPRLADLGGTITQPAADDGGDRLIVLFGDSFSESALPGTAVRFMADPRLRLSPNVYGGTTFDTQTWWDGYRGVGDGSIVLLFLGRLALRWIRLGSLYFASSPASAAIIRFSSSAAPGLAATTATTASPKSACGTPITAHSATPGSASIAFSTSAG